MAVTAPYDQIAAEYYDPSHRTSRNFDDTTVAAFRESKPEVPSEGLVLDVGAGRGRCGEFLRIPPNRIVQLDNSRRMLELQPREESLLRIVHQAEELPFLDGQFACVASFLCDAFLGLNFLAEAFRVLASPGVLVGTTPSHEWGVALRNEINIDTSETRFMTKAGARVLIPSLLVPADRLKQMLIASGFEQRHTEVRKHRLPSGLPSISPDIIAPASTLRTGVHDLDILYSFIGFK